MAFDTSGFNLSLGQQQAIVPSLAGLAPYAPNFQGLAFKPANIQAPAVADTSAIGKGIGSALGSIGEGIQVAYKNVQDEKKEAARAAMEKSKFIFEQKKHSDTMAAAAAKEAKDVAERMKGVYTPMPSSTSDSPPSLESMGTPETASDVGVATSEGNQYLKSIGRFEAPAEQTFSYKEERGQAGEPSVSTSPPTSAPKVPKPSISIVPPKLSYVAPPSTREDYIYNEQPYEDLRAGATQTLEELAPYVSANAGAGAQGVPSLPMGMDVPTKAPPTLYGLDLSKMKQQGEANQAIVNAEMQAQQVTPRETSGSGGDQFDPPPRPSANQIPKDRVFRSYDQARQEQAKDYGFYYEPMGEIQTFKDQNGPWYKVVRNPEKTSILEQKLARLETARQRYDKFNLQQQNTIDREQNKFAMSPAVKAFTSPNGMQQSFGRFAKDYDAISKNPEAAGISDVGLLDMFARAEGGGKVTEGQAALVLGSMGLVDKAKVLGYRLEGGDRLSQNQRDQMMRVIAEDYAFQANIANQAVKQTRDKLIKQGITDETSLPQPYDIPITKWEYDEKIKEAQAESTNLHIQRANAQSSGNTQLVNSINDRLRELQNELVPLAEAKRKSKGSTIINMYDIEHKPQGWIGGAVNVFQQQ
jgi:hypothetical protein